MSKPPTSKLDMIHQHLCFAKRQQIIDILADIQSSDLALVSWGRIINAVEKEVARAAIAKAEGREP